MTETTNKSKKLIRIVQITDPHLFVDTSTELVGMNCEESLEDVLALVREQESDIDCVLCTGDIAQDASTGAYLRFEEKISKFDAPQLWIPGNHDVIETIRETLGEDSPHLIKSKVFGEWLILMLDSSVKGEIYGRLDPDELDFLNGELEKNREAKRHVLAVVHHNPVPVDAEWLQFHSLKNDDEFFAILDRYEQVKCVLFGHIHQDFKRTRNEVLILGSPATCIQFHPTNDHFTLDTLNPGYRWLDLHGDGTVETGIHRVTGKTYDIDMDSIGY